ncbi:MAG TPA: hypothetical protein VME20_08310 [Acidimicrobiales bacterium]|nr:hypothetical protein [Acidimicrobiales bacterium]
MSGCGASVAVRVVVARHGSGSVNVVLTLPRATAAGTQDLRAGLPLGDARSAGWVVTGPSPGPGGSSVLRATHQFTALAQVPDLLADIAGSGPAADRPFRLSVSEGHGLLEDSFAARGVVDLTCSLSCFDDPRLARNLGYPLGLPLSQLTNLTGGGLEQAITFSFQLSLPGSTQRSNATQETKSVLTWAPRLGSSTPVEATSQAVNVGFVRDVLIAVSAGAVLVAATAAWLLARRRRLEAEGAAGVPGARPPTE